MSELVQQARARQQGQKTIQQILNPVAGSLNTALASRIGVDRFMQAAVTAFRANDKLQRCTEDSILGALFLSAQLGLEIGGPRGLAYLVPYGNQATFVLGYKGVVELFYRTGQVRSVDAFLIRENDRFQVRWDADRGRVFDWQPGDTRAKPVGAVAYVVTTNGALLWEHMTEAEILARRPAQWTNGPWKTWPDQMWLKTVLKALPRKVRTASDDQSLQIAVEADQTVQRQIPGVSEAVVERVPAGEVGIPAQEPPTDAPMALADDDSDEADYWRRIEAEHAAATAEHGDEASRENLS